MFRKIDKKYDRNLGRILFLKNDENNEHLSSHHTRLNESIVGLEIIEG